MHTPQQLIKQAYAAFNACDIPTVLATLHPQVRWARAWEGNYATGHAEVRDYWQRQWQELDPHVAPTSIHVRPDGRLEVAVRQVVRDKQGALVFAGPARHLYPLRDGLLLPMDIEQG